MAFLHRLVARLRGAFAGATADADLRAELDAHLEMETAENIRRGMSPPDARRAALVSAGGMTQASEAVRDQRGFPGLDGVLADIRYAVRSLRHARAFVAVVVVTLALGIGANTAIFSVVRGVLLKPLPHRDGERLVYLRHSMDGPGGDNLAFSVPEVRDLREGAPSLAGIAEFSQWSMTLQLEDGAVRIPVGLVTGNYFEVMGLSPVLGRLTSAADDGPGAPPVMVLTHAAWMRRFGGDSGIVGRTLTVDKRPVTVIGVVEPAPFFPSRFEALLNMVNSAHHLSAFMVEGRTHRMTEIVARLAPAADVDRARNEVAAVSARLQEEYREAYDPASRHRFAVIPYQRVLGERASLTLVLLMGAAAFVMIISAANVANLTLMRGVRREHELVVRAALGAGVSRLRRLLLIENLMLALAGAALGGAIAVAGVRLLTSLAERYSPRASEIRLDAPVLAFAATLAVLVALMLSWIATLPREGSFSSWILSGAHRLSGRITKHRLQRGLVVVQVGVTVVLLAGAGLLTRTMVRLADVDTGLQTDEVLTIQVSLLTPQELLSNPAADGAAKARYEVMRREIAALPGVTAVGLGSPMPLRRSDVRFEVKAEGRVPEPGETVLRAELRTADPGFFRASGIPVVTGRPFALSDQRESPPVVVVNRVLADQLFPGEDAVGKRVAWTGDLLRFTPISDAWRTIVGVTANTQDGGLDASPGPVMYLPFAQMLALGGGLVIRSDSNVEAVSAAATRIVRRIAPTAPIDHVMTLSQYTDQSISPRRLNALLVSSFGILAVLIAAVGIAGVLAFSVSARTNEIGIRMSLGADRGRVQRMVLREGGVLVALGLALGIVGATFATRVIEGLLFDVAPRDPVTFAAVVLVMGGVGLLACWIPALRASRVDPAITMRA